MKVVGLITEYNPFHNGHKHHIEEAKRITGADYCIAVMSGNFVQRGTPAVIDKYSRTEMALRNGVDLVLELPVCYATGSAEYFALGAVSLLDQLEIVDFLCFGSEAGNIDLLQKAAKFIINTPASYDTALQGFLKAGATYPGARMKALNETIERMEPSEGEGLTKILTEPNNILGIEYLKAIHKLKSSILPVTIQRISAHYHERELSDIDDIRDWSITTTFDMSENIFQRIPDELPEKLLSDIPVDILSAQPVISSATAIRKAIHSKNDNTDNYFTEMKSSVPTDVYHLLQAQYGKTYPVTEEDFSLIIKYKLMTESRKSLTEYMDISGDLADRILNISDLNCSIAELIQKIKTKNMTMTRISRALIHLLLGIRKDAFVEYQTNGCTQYARVLGVRKDASHLLRQIERSGRIPIITKVSRANEKLDTLGLRMLSEDIFATHLYNQAVYEKYKSNILNEYKHGIVIL